jgi:hypothetical protein
MPKPIVRKTGGEDKLPPIETQMSPFSARLSAMATQQKQAFESLSPEAKKLHASIRDSERYFALTEKGTGVIDKLKRDAAQCSFRMAAAVDGFNAVNAMLEPSGSDGQPRPAAGAEEIRALRVAGLTLANIGRDLSSLVASISSLEVEAEQLEARVIDDSNLPDFRVLNDRSKQENVDDMARKASALAAEVVASGQPGSAGGAFADHSDTFAERIPEDAKPKPFCDDRPLYWESWYESGDKVVAPTKTGAQAMVAMRIRKTLKDCEINVWQVDEQGNMIDDGAGQDTPHSDAMTG